MILPITNGEAVIDETFAPLLRQLSWHKTPHGYASTSMGSKKLLMHRFLLGAKEHDIVDHINGNKLDNRLENLRFVTKAQNAQNSKKASATSGFLGVHRDGPYFKAGIKIRGKRKHLGMFKDPVEAALCYDQAARKYYGPDARTNLKHFAAVVGRLRGKATGNKV